MSKTFKAFCYIAIVVLLSSCSLATTEPEVPPSVLDTSVCKTSSSTGASVPSELYGHEVIDNITVANGDFTFDFWLYCDPALTPTDTNKYSAIAGLGVYSKWQYNGKKVEGNNQDYFGFGSDVRQNTSWVGPLYKSAGSTKYGISLDENSIVQRFQQKNPIEFRAIVESPLGKKGALFSFGLAASEKGYITIDLKGETFSE